VAVLHAAARADPSLEALLQRQVRQIRENATWELRATQWREWLSGSADRPARR
jgi:hypothetical protein